MKIGTKSLLWGYHQFLLHPLIVAIAWWKLYGFPWDPRLWFAFFLHDIGYIGKPNMDGPEGQMHPFLGADTMHLIFDNLNCCEAEHHCQRWFNFCLYHSRTMAKMWEAEVSQLCYADKLAFMLYPKWLLKLLYKLSGEYEHYMADRGLTDWDEWYAWATGTNEVTLQAVKMSKH